MGTRVRDTRLAVYILTPDAALRRALEASLALAPEFIAAPDGGRLDGMGAGDVLLATTTAVTAARVADLAATGLRVIVLAPFPRIAQREQYESAGAVAYLPMAGDRRQLVERLRAALGLKPPPDASSSNGTGPA